jgi:NADH:ubiquinone oxidoreductase subunit 5 (subunit L)/multisubunit Na+/H+ antiporter MnhA subunit
MITHAFFKALLFLGSGSVIHGMHHEQDMRRYGGLYKLMPITAGTFIIGWLAIAGVPPFAGFWSKDEILLYAFDNSPALWFVGLVTALLTAFYMTRQVILTFFGRTRFFDAHADEIDAAFVGRIDAAVAEIEAAREGLVSAEGALEKAKADVPKRTEGIEKAQATLADATAAVEASTPEAEGHDKLVKALDKATKGIGKAEDALAKAESKVAEAEAAVVAAEQAQVDAAARRQELDDARRNAPTVPQYVNAHTPAPDISDFEDAMPASYRERQEYHPHESPWTMTLPLVALSGLAIVAGGLNLPFTKDLHFLEHWLEPSLFANEHKLGASTGTKWILAGIAIAVGLIAIAAAFAVYWRGRTKPEVVENPGLGLAVRYDEAIAAVAGGPGTAGFDRAAWFDKTFVDGAVNGVPALISATASRARGLQSGFVRSYGLVVVLGTAALAVVLLRSLVL